MRSLSFAAWTWVALVLETTACQTHDETSRAAVRPAPVEHGADRHVRVVYGAAVGDLPAAVRDEMARAAAERRRVVVYIGAEWCEPCSKFLRAAESGELDSAFGDVTLLRFDSERDRERLQSAGYTSRYIPLFVLPTLEGTSSGKQIEGGIKGDGAVEEIASRLTQLLDS
jgi:thioredoxin family protein